MTKTAKVVIIPIFVITIFGLIFYYAYQDAKALRRDPTVLINRYFLLKDTDPAAAKQALIILLQQDKNNPIALKELSNLYWTEGRMQEALPLIQRLNKLDPNNPQYRYQLGKIYYDNSNWTPSIIFFQSLVGEKKGAFHMEASNYLNQMKSIMPNYRISAKTEVKMPEPQTLPYGFTQIVLDKFYALQKEDPKQAESWLELLTALNPNNALFHQQMGYLALQRKDELSAISSFLLAYDINHSAQIALQLAYLYMNNKHYQEASEFFLLASHSEDPKIREAALRGYEFAIPPGKTETASTTKPPSEEMVLMDEYYLLKKRNKEAAWTLLQKIIAAYPNNINALNEGGFLGIELKHKTEAIHYFTRAYMLTNKPELAMQLGYLYADTPNTALAYRYFNRASKAEDHELALKAETAKTNLAGLQTRAFPPPYFSEIFFDPFSQTRFGLTVTPLVARLGIEQNNALQSKTYAVFRQSMDNKSGFGAGQLPQIYEDNVRIIGVGLQITPLRSIPLVGFAEVGGAYDLIYRFRPRWRADFRGGVMYYNELGAKPAFFDKLKVGGAYYSTYYGDLTYFTRYDNLILTLKTHQGLRLFQYKSSMINLYMSGRVIEDTQREFFNNIAEVGPGIAFIPSNRYRLELRFEHIAGTYLPAGGSFNPYGKHYINNTVQLLTYVKI